MARRRRTHYQLLEALEPRSYLSVTPGGAVAAVGVNLADGTPTRLYRTPALLQSQGNGGTLKATPTSIQSAQAYFDVIMGYPPPTLNSGPTATLADPSETTAALSVSATSGSPDSKLTYTWAVQSGPNANAVTFSDNNDDSALNTIATFHAAGNYVFAVTVSDGVRITTGTVGIEVDSIASSIVVVPGMTQGTGGTLSPNGSSPFAAVVSDQFGQAMTSATVTWSLDSGSIGTISSSGVYQAPAQSGSATIRATSGSLSNALTITVGNHAPVIVNGASSGSSNVTGAGTTLNVLASDDGGESGLSYSWSLTSQPANANTIFSDNNDNSAKATTVTFSKAGTYTFLVTISDGTLTTSSTVTLNVVQKITSIAVSPANSTLNLNGSTTLNATAYDQFGAALTTQPTFTWSKTGVGSVNAAGVFAAGATSGGATVTASAGGVSGSAAVTVANAAPTIATPASGPSTVTTTSAVLSVLGADDGGESGLTYSWALLSGPAGVAFSSNGGNGSKNTSVTFTRAGNYSFQVTVSDGSLTTTSSLTLQVAQTLSSIVVTPGSFSLALNQTRNLLATGYDQFGQQMTAQPSVTWSKVSGVGSVNSAGIYTSGATAGVVTIQALADGVSGTATATVGNTAPTVVNPASGPSSVTTTSATLSVLGADDGGENNLTYTWSLTGSPTGGTATFSANGTNAAKSTVATFNKAGAYTFLVTLSDGSLTTTSTVTLTVVQTLSSIVVTPGSASLTLNGTRSLSAVAYDQFNAAMSTQPAFTWTKTSGVGGVNASGTYSAGTSAGSATITASAGGVSGSATMTVGNAAPTIATPAGGPGTITGKTATLTVLGADDGGEAGLTYTWSLTSGPGGGTVSLNANGTNGAKSTVATFTKAGSYSFLVTVSDGSLTATSSVTVTVNQALTTIGVSPSSSSLSANGSETLAATGYDQFGQALTVQPTFTWTLASGVGSVNSSGVYSAGTTPGSATITASSGGIGGSATVTVANQAPTIATPASGPSTVGISSANLSVLGADDGGESHLIYTWSIVSDPTGASPSFSINGTNAAKNTMVLFNRAGSYTFLVTVSDGSSTATSSLTLTVQQTMTSIQVSPGTQALNAYAVQQFSATAYDQFGQMLATQPAFTWTVDSGGDGTVAGGGAFTAGGTSGSATVRATSGSLSGAASVTVSATSGNAAVVTTRNLTSFTELVITGTSGNDTISVSESGNTFTIISNGITQTVTGTFGDVAIHAGSGGSTITVASNVTINTLVYGGAGSDTLNDFATGSYNAIVSIGGGTDSLTGNGVNTNYWADTADTVNASTTETNAGRVNRVSGFYQPWTTDTTSPDYVGVQLNGQSLRDPSDIGTVVHYTANSLWGVTPTFWDVHQNGLADCFLLADTQALAISSPSTLETLAIDLGDGTYAVRFKRSGVYQYVRVDGDFSQGQALPGASGALWTVVIEKAYAFFRTGANTYSSINLGATDTVFNDLGIANTGTAVAFGTPSSLYSTISTALAAGKAQAFMSNSSISGGIPIIASHCYSVYSIAWTGSSFNITLRNPWGTDGAGADGNPGDGLVTITAAQFQSAFFFGSRVN
ncbi:MAG TPA: C2 family cysteine protease [Phycisphaerae bacterium]|nr:C2 family cysteine protease [Phycisphaerae bacterium]